MIRHYTVLKCHQILSRGMAIIFSKKSAKIRMHLTDKKPSIFLMHLIAKIPKIVQFSIIILVARHGRTFFFKIGQYVANPGFFFFTLYISQKVSIFSVSAVCPCYSKNYSNL